MGKDFKKWEHVMRVERTEFTVVLKGVKFDTMYEFKTPQECLKNFLELRKEYEQAWSFPGPTQYRNGTKW